MCIWELRFTLYVMPVERQRCLRLRSAYARRGMLNEDAQDFVTVAVVRLLSYCKLWFFATDGWTYAHQGS